MRLVHCSSSLLVLVGSVASMTFFSSSFLLLVVYDTKTVATITVVFLLSMWSGLSIYSLSTFGLGYGSSTSGIASDLTSFVYPLL